ncbi:isoprenyl transferase [Thiotrichales bacterium 19S11-10]|nr:isoprenyl transferase [Thiotrichales bacterium 19S11-10]
MKRSNKFDCSKVVDSIIPKHIAIIMDGNGRWAKKRFLPRTIGHKLAVKQVRDIIAYANELKVKVLTLFAFGRENWARPKEEVESLMGLFSKVLIQEIKKLDQHNVCFRMVGDRSRLSEKIKILTLQAEEKTKNNQGLVLQLAIDYSGRWDIVQSVNQIISKLKDGEEVTEEMLSQQMQEVQITDPDLLIRTSGEQRISNFMLWQLAYTELYFTDVLWPDFTRKELDKAIASYASRQRRYGKTSEQISDDLVKLN